MIFRLFSLWLLVTFSGPAMADPSPMENHPILDLSSEWVGYLCLVIFIGTLLVVVVEEFTLLRKSKPMLLAAGLMWGLIAWAYSQRGIEHIVEAAFRENFLVYIEILLFMLVVITYVNALRQRGLFQWMACGLGERGYSYRRIYWSIGLLCFSVSPWVDNLATAIFFAALLLTIARESPRVVTLGCVHIVVAANAGGVFSGFGDVATLLVWRANLTTHQGALDLLALSRLFLPALVSYLLSAWLIGRALPDGHLRTRPKRASCKQGTGFILLLFLITLLMAVAARKFLHLPAVLGMMSGLSLLMFYGYTLRMRETHLPDVNQPFDIVKSIAGAEWNSLLFLYGVIACSGALAFIGYLPRFGAQLYQSPGGATLANIGVAGLSAILDNIPVQNVLLTMHPHMSLGQWLLAIFSAGTGGSLLSIGSTAGVGLMGLVGNRYTFFGHLRWLPAILTGYFAGVLTHFLVNGRFF